MPVILIPGPPTPSLGLGTPLKSADTSGRVNDTSKAGFDDHSSGGRTKRGLLNLVPTDTGAAKSSPGGWPACLRRLSSTPASAPRMQTSCQVQQPKCSSAWPSSSWWAGGENLVQSHHTETAYNYGRVCPLGDLQKVQGLNAYSTQCMKPHQKYHSIYYHLMDDL